MGVVRRFVEEQVLHDDAFHGGKTGRNVMRVRVRLQDVLALDVKSLERAVDRGIEHVRDAQARLLVERDVRHSASNIARVASSAMCR